MRERLVLLEVCNNGFVLARRTETGQFTPVGGERKVNNHLRLEAEKLGHLGNVAARVAFELGQQNSLRFGEVDTTDPSSIAEGKPSDSLRVILGRRKNREKLVSLSEILMREFGRPGIRLVKMRRSLYRIIFYLFSENLLILLTKSERIA